MAAELAGGLRDAVDAAAPFAALFDIMDEMEGAGESADANGGDELPLPDV